jgi:MFS family permease
VDRRRRVVVITTALVVWSLVLGAAGLATGFLLLALARLVSGAVATVARPAAVSVAGDSFEPGERGRATAVLAVAGVVGVSGCYLLGALSVGLLNWRWMFVLLGAAGVLLSLASSRQREPGGRTVESPRFVEVMGSLLRIRTN